MLSGTPQHSKVASTLSAETQKSISWMLTKYLDVFSYIHQNK